MSNGGQMVPESSRKGVSREDAETLCLLLLIGAEGRASSELCRKLGIVKAHEPVLAEVLKGMAGRGEVVLDETRVSLSAQGREWMEATLARVKAG